MAFKAVTLLNYKFNIEIIIYKLNQSILKIIKGLCCSIIPTYLNEISPANLRGQIGVFHNLFLTAGILIGQVLSFEKILGFLFILVCSIKYEIN
jgi:hypothetical protein